jgi:WD40 repeat protein
MVHMLMTRCSNYLFFGSGDPNNPKQINKFSVNKKEIVARFEDPAFERGVASMALSPDSNSLYFGTRDKLVQFSLKDGKVIQSRNINDRRDMRAATIYAMCVTRNNQYLVTGIAYDSTPEKGDVSRQKKVIVGGRVCVWSTKDLTLVKT